MAKTATATAVAAAVALWCGPAGAGPKQDELQREIGERSSTSGELGRDEARLSELEKLLARLPPPSPVESKGDRLCRAIGQTREIALQPRDRIYYEEKCSEDTLKSSPYRASKVSKLVKAHRDTVKLLKELLSLRDQRIRSLQPEAAAEEAPERAAAERRLGEERAAAERRRAKTEELMAQVGSSSGPLVQACRSLVECMGNPRRKECQDEATRFDSLASALGPGRFGHTPTSLKDAMRSLNCPDDGVEALIRGFVNSH